MASIPTKGEAYAKLIDHLRHAQEEAATLGHLAGANGDSRLHTAWLAVSELMRGAQEQVIQLATRGLQ